MPWKSSKTLSNGSRNRTSSCTRRSASSSGVPSSNSTPAFCEVLARLLQGAVVGELPADAVELVDVGRERRRAGPRPGRSASTGCPGSGPRPSARPSTLPAKSLPLVEVGAGHADVAHGLDVDRHGACSSRRGGPGRRWRSRRTRRPPRSGPSARSSGRRAAAPCGISLSATIAPSSGLTRSSRPQVSRVCLRSLCASRQSMPSSAVSGFQNDIPIERIASRRAGRGRVGEPLLDQLVGDQLLVDDHRRDERAQRLAASGRAPKSISRCTPSVGSAWKRLSDSPPGPIRTSRPTRSGWLERQPHRRTAAEAVAEQVDPLDAELVEQLDDVVGARAGSSCRPPAACRSRRSRAGRPAGCGSDAAKRGSARAEVGPRRGAGAAAVQHHQRQAAADVGRARPAS